MAPFLGNQGRRVADVLQGRLEKGQLTVQESQQGPDGVLGAASTSFQVVPSG